MKTLRPSCYTSHSEPVVKFILRRSGASSLVVTRERLIEPTDSPTFRKPPEGSNQGLLGRALQVHEPLSHVAEDQLREDGAVEQRE